MSGPDTKGSAQIATQALPNSVTDDAFLGGAVRLLQPRNGYRAGIDAVLLAAAVPVAAGQKARVLDVGAGVGAAGLCLASRASDAEVALLEPEPEYAALARENVARNGLGARVRVAEAAVGARETDLKARGIEAETFDHVLANPPFHERGRGTRAPDALKDAAHAMDGDGLDAWCRFMARMARPGGTATLIHKADALGDVLAAMRGRFGALKVVPIHAREGEPAIRVIVQGVKGSRGPLTLLPGVVLHGEGDAFRPEIDQVLRHGAALRI